MSPPIIDPSLNFQFEDDQLVGSNGSYVDDIFRQGTDEWQTHSDATLERFETTGNQQEPFAFAWMHITESHNVYNIEQDFYMSKIEQIPPNAEFSKFASLRMKLAWVANTRPDAIFQIKQIAQANRVIYEKDITKHFKPSKKAIKNAHDHKEFILIP